MRDPIINDPLIACILDAFPGAVATLNGVPLMLDLSSQEIAAIQAASPAGGEYLDRLGKTDLAQLSEAEWMGFLEAVITAFLDSMAKQHAPFAVLRSHDDPMPMSLLPDITAAEASWAQD
ncbi:MAG: hypothetical protein NVS1B6_16820 [Steroidobacteraceae bacterium]